MNPEQHFPVKRLKQALKSERSPTGFTVFTVALRTAYLASLSFNRTLNQFLKKITVSIWQSAVSV